MLILWLSLIHFRLQIWWSFIKQKLKLNWYKLMPTLIIQYFWNFHLLLQINWRRATLELPSVQSPFSRKKKKETDTTIFKRNVDNFFPAENSAKKRKPKVTSWPWRDDGSQVTTEGGLSMALTRRWLSGHHRGCSTKGSCFGSTLENGPDATAAVRSPRKRSLPLAGIPG